MAGSVNKVILLGHLGKDPETKSFPDGGSITSLNLATSESWKDKRTGERKEQTEWHRVAILNPTLGDIVQKYAGKGDQIYIEGNLRTRKWTDKAGVDHYQTEVVVKGFSGVVNLIGGKDRNARSTPRTSDYDDEAPAYPPPRSNGGARNDLDDEIPF